MDRLDFSFLTLTKEDKKTLKKSEHDHVPYRLCHRLLRYQLVQKEVFISFVEAEGEFRGYCSITDLGKDYLLWLNQQRHARQWENTRYWITTAIAFAALIKAFIPELSAATAWLLKLLKLQ